MAMGPILASGRRGRRAPMSEINVTPMVDVMLVLLIIFMVTAPLLASGVQVDVPESKAAPLEQSGAPIALSMNQQGEIYLDDVRIEPAQLGTLLRQRVAASREEGGPRLFLRADRALDYGSVNRVMGEINAAGIRKLSLVSTGADGGQ
ncbi:MAG TPA: ExbD/TolR family protein [Allosphingosinicella sp.]|nr:ExbD/TolR family protein [Allosphingosinicella sp.]